MASKAALTFSTKPIRPPEARPPADDAWPELSVVALRHDATGIGGVPVREGARGTIVSVWTPGHYAVEFTEPATVASLAAADLILIEQAP